MRSVGAFRTPYADPLSFLLSERPVRRNPVVAEGIILRPWVSCDHESPYFTRLSRPRALVQIGSLRGSVSILLETH